MLDVEAIQAQIERQLLNSATGVKEYNIRRTTSRNRDITAVPGKIARSRAAGAGTMRQVACGRTYRQTAAQLQCVAVIKPPIPSARLPWAKKPEF